MAEQVKPLDPCYLDVDIDIVLRLSWWADWLDEIVDPAQQIQVRFTSYAVRGWPTVVRPMQTENPAGFSRKEFIDAFVAVHVREHAGVPHDHVFYEGSSRADDGIWDVRVGS